MGHRGLRLAAQIAPVDDLEVRPLLLMPNFVFIGLALSSTTGTDVAAAQLAHHRHLVLQLADRRWRRQPCYSCKLCRRLQFCIQQVDHMPLRPRWTLFVHAASQSPSGIAALSLSTSGNGKSVIVLTRLRLSPSTAAPASLPRRSSSAGNSAAMMQLPRCRQRS